MAPPRQPTSISSFMLGAVIPKELVGDILEQLYLKGLEGSLQCQPVYDKAAKKQQLIEEEQHAALPPPAKVRNRHGNRNYAPTPTRPRPAGMTIKEFLYRLIEEKQPISRTAIGQHGDAAGLSANSVTTNLWRMKLQKWIKAKGDNYTIGPKVPRFEKRAPQRPAPQPASGGNGAMHPHSQTSVLLDYLRKAGGPVTLATASDLFRQHRLRPQSASVALNSLKKKGIIRHIGPATYEYIHQTPTTSEAETLP